MENEIVEIRQLLRRLRAQGRKLSLVVGACVVFGILLALVLPKQFKSTSVITIYSQYFQNPLVRDFVPEVNDSIELKAQRESLVHQAFHTGFLDQLGERNGFFRSPPGSKLRTVEREELRRRIEIIGLNSDSFQIAFVGSTREMAFSVANQLVDQLTEFLLGERRRLLTNLRDGLQNRMEKMGVSVAKAADPTGALPPETIRHELQRVEQRLVDIRERYADEHPLVVKLQARATKLRRALSAEGTMIGVEELLAESAPPSPEPPTQTQLASLGFYKDLLRKSTYLDVAIGMETAEHPTSFGILERPSLPGGPVFPRKTVFALWGFLGGIFLAAVLGLIDQPKSLVLQKAVHDLETELVAPTLGKLPRLAWPELATRVPRQLSAPPPGENWN